jgi:hypothetical protein
MMHRVVIFPTSTGVAVMYPMGDFSDDDTAKKDVPAGTPYLIVDPQAMPDKPDFSKPDGVGLGHDAFMKQYVDLAPVMIAAYAENTALDQAYDEMRALAEQENRQWDALQALKA